VWNCRRRCPQGGHRKVPPVIPWVVPVRPTRVQRDGVAGVRAKDATRALDLTLPLECNAYDGFHPPLGRVARNERGGQFLQLHPARITLPDVRILHSPPRFVVPPQRPSLREGKKPIAPFPWNATRTKDLNLPWESKEPSSPRKINGCCGHRCFLSRGREAIAIHTNPHHRIRGRSGKSSRILANRSSHHRCRPLVARPPTGASSCRSMTIATSFKPRPTICR